MSKSRVWIVSEIYWPDETSTGYFVTEIAEDLARVYRVFALCGQPRYDQLGVRRPAVDNHGDVTIFRMPGARFNRNAIAGRLVNALTMSCTLFLAALRRFRRGDVVLVTTNPPIAPMLIAAAARMRGARAILILQDLYPDVLVAAGLARPGSLMLGIAAWASRRMYGSMESICTCGRDMAASVRSRVDAKTAARVQVIPNWGEVEIITPQPRIPNSLREELGLGDSFVVLYAGNAGRVHDVATIVAAADQLQARQRDVRFVFIGSGARWTWLGEEVKRRGLRNVELLSPRPRAEQEIFLAAGDVSVSAFVPGMTGVGVPSRMYNIMAAGRPMIAAVDPDSEQALVIHDDDIGWVVRPADPDALVAAIEDAKSDVKRLADMGERARASAERRYTRATVVSAYRALVAKTMID